MKTEKPDPPEPPPRNPLRVMASISTEVNLHFINNTFQSLRPLANILMMIKISQFTNRKMPPRLKHLMGWKLMSTKVLIQGIRRTQQQHRKQKRMNKLSIRRRMKKFLVNLLLWKIAQKPKSFRIFRQ